MSLTATDRRFLVCLARRSLEAAVLGGPSPDPDALARELDLAPSTACREPRGAFVTLTTADGDLRGCIGTVEGRDPLARVVAEHAVNAALQDPRFPPVGPEELPELNLEVSALTPLQEVTMPADIEVGRHGVLLSRGGRRAVFLPQVAPEQGWDRDTMLSQLALKAGLGPDDWRNGCRFQVFEAEICEE